MSKKLVVLAGGLLLFVLGVSAFFILSNNRQINKKTEVLPSSRDKERAIKEADKQVKILAEEQENGRVQQEERLREYEIKIFEEKDKNRRIILIKEMIAFVGTVGIDASAIPVIDGIKEKLIDNDEKKLILNKVKSIMKNRDMRAELEEYEKYNK